MSFYLLLVALAYLVGSAWQQSTVISAFHLPPENRDHPLPFSQDTVADVVRDAIMAVGMQAQGRGLPQPCSAVAGAAGESGGLPAPASPAFEAPTPVAVEVKGFSAPALVAAVRSLLRRERLITGDVVLVNGDSLQLLARADDAGPWAEGPAPLSLDGLKEAGCKLAEDILASTDKNLLAAALIRRGKYDRVAALYGSLPSAKLAAARAP